MDNDNFSKIPVSELTKEHLDSLKSTPEGAAAAKAARPVRERRQSNRSRLPLFVAGAVLLIGIAVALYFIFRPAPTPDGTDASDSADSEVIWAPAADSTDPSGDYISHQQSIINNSDATTDEKLEAQLSIANLYSVTERYGEAQTLLDSISRGSLTHRQLFNLYSAYAYLYEHSGDTAAYNEYSLLVEETLNAYWGEEETAEE